VISLQFTNFLAIFNDFPRLVVLKVSNIAQKTPTLSQFLVRQKPIWSDYHVKMFDMRFPLFMLQFSSQYFGRFGRLSPPRLDWGLQGDFTDVLHRFFHSKASMSLDFSGFFSNFLFVVVLRDSTGCGDVDV
jgi:hypothetical protein